MQQSLEEILRAKMAVPVSIKGKEGATVMPMEAIAMAIMNNAMCGEAKAIAKAINVLAENYFAKPDKED